MGADILYVTPCCGTEDYEELKVFKCYIKSHCEAPDWEKEIFALDLEEALEEFAWMTGWSKEDLRKYVGVESEESGVYRCELCGNEFDKLCKEVVDYDEGF